MTAGPWLPDGPDFVRRSADGAEVARLAERHGSWWWTTRDHEGQSGDRLAGAMVRADVALMSSVRGGR